MTFQALRRACLNRYPGLRLARRDRPLGFCEHELLAALREVGCPICRVAQRSEPDYLFWLLHEGYTEPNLFEALTASLGFCGTHAAAILRNGGGASQVALMHGVVAKRLVQLWRDPRRARTWTAKIAAAGGAPGPCPVCRSRAAAGGRAAFFLAKLIESPATEADYARPGLVCAPHLGLLAPHLRTPTLARLMATHADALGRALAALETRAPGGDAAQAQRSALRLAVGHPAPPDSAAQALPLSRRGVDLDAELETLIGEADGCAVCRVVARARDEWIAWLDETARAGETVEDLLPVCSVHVWDAWAAAGPPLRAALARNAVQVARHKVETTRKFLARTPPPFAMRHPLAGLASAIQGRRPFVRLARAAVARAERCPLCARLATARDRSLALLFALLEERRHRDAFEAGYGLCVKHFARALACGPVPLVRDFLIGSETAKLARLAWALDEYGRKLAWQARPEAPGVEKRAPVAALDRFGSWGESLRIDVLRRERKGNR